MSAPDADLVVGIDLGTTNSCIAIKRNNAIEVIPNREGKRTTLSYVFYSRNGKVVIGKPAKHEAASNPSNGIYEVKRLIGCLHDDPEIEAEKDSLSYNLTRGTNGEIKIELDIAGEKQQKLPEEVCARILRKLKSDAEDYLLRPVNKAVITVPAYFNNNQRAATRDAAKIAGLEVLKLVNEPSAAALAYIHENKSDRDKIILIYDLGGGTFDVSIVKVEEQKLRVLSVDGHTHLGGQDFLNRLVGYVTEEIEEKCKIRVRNNKRFMRKIMNLCEATKKILTSSERTVIVPEFSTLDDEEVELVITREKFEELNRDLFEETIEIVDNCIRNRRLSKDDIDEILLVGGSSRIPKIESLLKSYFNNKKPIQRNINADEAIAIGAAIEADFFMTQSPDDDRNHLLVDVLPLSIGTVLDQETIFFNFARNTPLPAISKQIQCLAAKSRNRKSKNHCVLSFYEGEHLDYKKNVLLGAHEVRFNTIKNPKKNVEITMQINTNGIIRITASGDTIKTFNILLNKGRLDDEEIENLQKEIQN